MVEPTRGRYNEAYIQSLVNLVEKLNKHDIHVILDMHQDCWSPLFCNAHGIPSEYAQGYNNSGYEPGGSKAYPEPIAKPTYDSHGQITDCEDVGEHVFGWATCYVSYAIGAAAQRLYDNDQGILDRFGMFWQKIAGRVMNYPNVLGYELLNEPWIGDAPLTFEELLPTNPHWDLWFPTISDHKNMAKMYKALHEYIRKVDNDTILFFEPASGGNFLDAWPVGFDEGPGGTEYNDRQALAYHVYCPFVDTKKATDFIQHIIASLNMDACDLFNDAMYDVRKHDTAKLKLAGFLTEFGNAGTGVAAEDTIHFAAKKMDEFLHGWIYWYLTPDLNNPNSTEVQALARPFAHKIAGVPTVMEFDPKTKKFTLEYLPCSEAPCANYPTEIYTSKDYTYSAGIQYDTQTLNNIHGYFNDTIQMWYIQTIKIVPGEPIRVSITSPKT